MGEINDCNLFFLRDHEVEFVEVSVDETVLGESNNLGNELVVNVGRTSQAFDMRHRVSLN